MQRYFALILSVILLLCACSAAPGSNETEESTVPQIEIHPDRVKCTVPMEVTEGNYYYKVLGDRELYIEFCPPTKQVYDKAPVLMMISGGGFVECSVHWAIEYFGGHIDQLREAGFAVASVEYRVRDEGVNIMQVYSDIADAMRYLSYYSEAFGIDPTKFITAGHSAGGTASLAMAYIGNRVFDEDAYWPEADYQVIGAFSMSGTGNLDKTDFGPFGGYSSSGIQANTSLYLNEEIRKLASPIYYLEGSKVPCRLLMGEMDNVVSPISVEKFKEACDKAGVPCDVVWFKHAGHVYESMDGEIVMPPISVQKSKILEFAIQCVEKAK